MKRLHGVLVLLGVLAMVAACGSQPEPEQPAPVTPGVDSAAIRARLRQDSIDAANRRRAEEEAARAAAERSADAAAEALRHLVLAQVAGKIDAVFAVNFVADMRIYIIK